VRPDLFLFADNEFFPVAIDVEDQFVVIAE